MKDTNQSTKDTNPLQENPAWLMMVTAQSAVDQSPLSIRHRKNPDPHIHRGSRTLMSLTIRCDGFQ